MEKLSVEINFTVWSEVFACPECSSDVVFLEEALDEKTQSVNKIFDCPSCSVKLTRRSLERKYQSSIDKATGAAIRGPTRKPIIIDYSVGGKSYQKKPDLADLSRIANIEEMTLPGGMPVYRMMHAPVGNERWGDEWRSGVAAFTHIHHLFLPRSGHALSALWANVSRISDVDVRRGLYFFIEQAIWSMSLLNRYSTDRVLSSKPIYVRPYSASISTC